MGPKGEAEPWGKYAAHEATPLAVVRGLLGAHASGGSLLGDNGLDEAQPLALM
jgi:hypothetical protein